MAVKLTPRTVENLKASDKRQQIADTLLPGLALIVQPTGKKSWTVRYRAAGKQRRMLLGDYPAIPLKEAREKAREIQSGVIEGDDPALARRKKRDAPTIATLAEEWLGKHATGLKSFSAINGYMRNDVVPSLGDMKVADIRRRDFIEIIEAKAEKTPRAAAQLLTYSRLLMDYATDRDMIPANPLAGLKPKSIKVAGKRDPLKAVKRGRVLTDDEIAYFWANVEACGMHKLSALALKMILLTGQRPGEVAGMRDNEITGRLWTIPADRRGKTETAHEVYLSDTALSLIDAAKAELGRLQKRRSAPPSGHIFEASPGMPVSNSALWRAVMRHAEALGATDDARWGHWTPHDLRRTMRTRLSALKVAPHVAELVIGHVPQGILAVYDHHDFAEEKQAALEAWDSEIASICKKKD
ncbi:tyrosine-type recombinase/integrase [Sulfitobacter sp. 1A13368]|uniref:tyrosine-type recombinase/integrase n=1 Tax=Sulfitobacter sp. 1A13368 TaxID=3368593 RepID=UPI00374637CC